MAEGEEAKTGAWWNKFHFSGRVIMCSVLFGLGLILIGGLIFAINMDDDSKKNGKAETADELPTTAPSNYVGPVVIGIGGFIGIVGIIMCLFETQVCRKKTADSKPLISDKNPVPSSSQCHKHRKHKNPSSPRKMKKKPKQAPTFIDKSKSFTTSSEDNFLTPPNTLDEHVTNSREAEIQTSSSLTTSGTWNQFLTPISSPKEKSIFIDNSVELYDQVNFKINQSTHYDYVTKEEETIQVKHETGKQQSEENVKLSSDNIESDTGQNIPKNDSPLIVNSGIIETTGKYSKILDEIKTADDENTSFDTHNNVSDEFVGKNVHKHKNEDTSSSLDSVNVMQTENGNFYT